MKLKYIYSLVIILCLSYNIISLNLIPDKTNPIQINNLTNEDSGSKLTIRFSFPQANYGSLEPSKNGSSSLNYRQFIGIKFPDEIFSNDILNNLSSNSFSCDLSDGVYNYKMTSQISQASPINNEIPAEKNIIYCRLDENSEMVPLKKSTIYKLTITFKSIKLATTNFINNISLFTSTSNNPEKIIIDSIPVLGSLASYIDYNKNSKNALDIDLAYIIVKQGTDSNGAYLYPFNTFDLYLVMKTNQYMSVNDFLFIIKYPKDTVTFVTEIEESGVKNTETSPKPNLKLIRFSEDSYLIDGFREDLHPNKEFTFIFKGLTSLDNNIDVEMPIQVLMYYKNTYSIFSYSSYDVFKINKISTNLYANHPEYWDIYRNGAWPIQFTIENNSQLSNGGYVVIQQSNTLNLSATGGNKISLIASTCDFSNNELSMVENEFGKRPFCFPLRTDFNYPNASSINEYKGSGIFFKLPKIIPVKMYRLTVWGFADACSGNDDNSYNPVNGKAYVIPKFEITIYKNINKSQLNEKRFSIMESGINQEIFSQNYADFNGKCWNAKIQSTDASDGVAYSETDLNKVTIDITNSIGNTGAILWYREFFDWQITSQMTSDAQCQNCWGLDISSNWPQSESFIYSSNNQLQTGSYFMVKVNIKNSGAIKMWQQIPHTITKTDENKFLPGHLIFQFPQSWFQAGDPYKQNPTCYASWGAWDDSVKTHKTLLRTPNQGIHTQTTNGDSNFFAGNSQNGNQIDSGSLLPPDNTLSGKSNILQLISTFNPGDNDDTGYKWKYMKDFTNTLHATNHLVIGYFTSCVKWTTNLPKIKSLWTYIDIQIKWTFRRSSALTAYGPVIAATRLIKLYPEGGVFNDFTNNGGTIGNTNPFINHMAYAGTTNSVCLIELSGSHIQNLSNRSSNTFVLWIMFGTLLETDYDDTSATYPTTQLYSGVSAYGLQSAPAMTNDNLYISNVNNYLNLTYILKLFNSTEDISPANTALYNGSYRTPYLFYMGSTLIFTGVSSNYLISNTNIVSPLLIPYYCPNYWFTNDVDKTAAFLPTIIGLWINMDSHIEVRRVGRYLTYLNSDNTNRPYYNILTNKYKSNGFVTSPQKGIGDSTNFTYSNSSLLATLKFNPYSNAIDNVLYVFNGTNQNGASLLDVTCTGNILFLSNSVKFDDSVTFLYNSGYSGYLSNYSSDKTFYVFGKPFNKAILYGLDSAIGVSNNIVKISPVGIAVSSQIYFTGIKRPTLDSFIKDGNFSFLDKLAFFCASCGKSDYNFLTNYHQNSSKTNPNFMLDLNSSDVEWIDAKVNWDKSEVFKNDYAGNLKIKINPPKSIPGGSLIELKSVGNFNRNTICGILSTNTKIVTECSYYQSNETIQCVLPIETSQLTACCYNLKINDSVSISYLSVILPNDKNSNTSKMTSIIFTALNQINSSINPLSIDSKGLSEISDDSSIISNVLYSQVNQENGFGKITFQVDLIREITRDMKLYILGDLNDLRIDGISIRCLVSFSKEGTNNDSNDLLFDSCSTNNLSSIKISTKKIVYKCEQSFAKTFYISLWPIKMINFNNLPKKFKIWMNLNTSDVKIANSKEFELMSSKLDEPPKLKYDNLCSVVKITPPIVGELSDYEFELDLESTKNSLFATSPNEVTIFWPNDYYGSHFTNINCFFKKIKLNCLFTDQGIMNIRFDTSLPFEKILITITNIPNPFIKSDLSFGCTVNNTNFLENKRINILTGIGKLSISLFKNPKVYGNLIFRYLNNSVDEINPRKSSTHIFRILFDNQINYPNNDKTSIYPILIENFPIFHIYFPDQYKFSQFDNFKENLKVTIDQYEHGPNLSLVKKSSFTPTIIQTGNRISLIIQDVSILLQINFQYFEITLNNIINPPNEESITKPFSIILTNLDHSIIYKTFQNLINFYQSQMTQPIDEYLKWNRGNSFSFDNTKWVIDIHSKSNESELNILSIKSGRFTFAVFSIRNLNNDKLNSAVNEIKLNENKIIKTSEESYKIVTSLKKPVEFMIGCSCETLENYYIVEFTQSDSTNFSELAKVIISISRTPKSLIQFENPNIVNFGGSTWIKLNISEPNFDDLKIRWTAVDVNINELNASIKDTIISPRLISNLNDSLFSIFSILSSQTSKNIFQFSTTDPNQCYTWGNSNLISLNLQGQVSFKFPENMNLINSFKYYNSESDSTLVKKNSIKFSILPPISNVYIYCALMCYDNTFPNESEIISPKIAKSNFIQFYKNLLINTSQVDFIFNELIRGMKYKLKCILQTSEGNETNRNSTSVIIDSNPNQKNSSDYIIPVKSQNIKCARFNFYSDPGDSVKLSIINYCQKMFTSQGYLENGCIICTDSEMKFITSGYEIKNKNSCKNMNFNFINNTNITTNNYTVNSTNSTDINNSSIIANSTNNNSTKTSRVLQISTIPDNYKNITKNQVYFTVCPVPNPNCPTDIISENYYFETLNNFIGQLNTKENILTNLKIDNIYIDPYLPQTLISDLIKPDLNRVKLNVTIPTTGNLTINFYITSGNPLICYYQIKNLNETVNSLLKFESIQDCQDFLKCGKIKINENAQSIITNSKVENLIKNVTYQVYLGCLNDILFSENKSEVKIITDFKIINNTSGNSTTNINNSTSNIDPGNSTVTISSLYFNYSIILYIILFIII